MDQATQAGIIRRIAELLGAKTTHVDGGETVVDAAPAIEKAKGYWQKNHDILLGAIGEDVKIGESIQAGMRAGLLRGVGGPADPQR